LLLGAAISAALMLVAGVAARPAAADACSACYAQHNQCRMQTKGSPSCDARLQQCLQSCRTGK